jgi:hypothetical protein
MFIQISASLGETSSSGLSKYRAIARRFKDPNDVLEPIKPALGGWTFLGLSFDHFPKKPLKRSYCKPVVVFAIGVGLSAVGCVKLLNSCKDFSELPQGLSVVAEPPSK